MSEFNPSKIMQLMGFMGWTYKDFAGLTGISEHKLSRISKGLSPFREEDVEAIRLASGFPLSFFLLDENVIPASELTFRKPSRMIKRDITRVSIEFSWAISSAKRLSKMCDTEHRADWINEVAPIEAPSNEDIEQLALETRRQLGISVRGPISNVMWTLESGGIAIMPMQSSDVMTKDGNSEGMSHPNENDIPVIGYSAHQRTGDGVRFTIAHEAGHIVLQRKRTPATKKITEDEAHRFAGAFLITEKDARSVMSPNMELRDFVDIKAGWGVSIAALITRAARLGIIDIDRQRSLMMQMSARHWRKSEPVSVKEERPLFLKQMLGSSFGEIESPTKISVSKKAVSDFLGRPFELINTWSDGLEQKKESDSLDQLM